MARELAEGVWLLDLGLVPPLATNAFLIDDSRRELASTGAGSGGDDGSSGGGDDPAAVEAQGDVTLVDTGLFWNLNSLRGELADAGYAATDIDRVLLTHYDLDHTGGLGSIAAELAGPVYIGEADGRLLAGEDRPNAFHHKGLFHRVVRRLFPLPDTAEVRHVRDGDEIGRFTAYHTPGHNPGHTVYVHDSGVAFLGDLVWEEEGELTPPFWLDSYDMRDVRESIRRFADSAPAFEVACMGHGTPLTTGGSDALERLVADL
jgi:glyoxylase-like metal-dependent hydrolase (beta-lactamase superfamily II)